MKFIAWLACIILWTLPVLAQSPSELFFPAEKNHIQILPQKFEYALLNKDQIRIGNVLIDANLIDFQITPINLEKNKYKLKFRWPAGFLEEGEISLIDNSGKGIWFHQFDSQQIELSADKLLASIEVETTIPSFSRYMQFYPYFRFCVNREETNTKTYLCSKNLFLHRDGDHIDVQLRDSLRPKSYLEINRRLVGNAGLIVLNSPAEYVSLKALLLSGATIEFINRTKEIDFKDVHLDEDGKKLILRAEGAEPVQTDGVSWISKTEWQVALDAERPMIYLKGKGGLPLLQEFLIRGDVPKSDFKIPIISGATAQTYHADHTLILKPPKDASLSDSDENSELQKRSDGSYRWHLKNLHKNEINRRWIKVSSEGKNYLAAYDLQRIAAFNASIRLMYPLWGQAHLIYSSSPRWAFEFEMNKLLSKSDNELDLQTYSLSGLYRLKPGMSFKDPTFSAEVFAQSIQVTNFPRLTTYGLGLQADMKSPSWWQNRFPWTFAKLRYLAGSSGSDFQLKSGYEAELGIRTQMEAAHYWELGIRTQHYSFSNSNEDVHSDKSMGFAGVGWSF